MKDTLTLVGAQYPVDAVASLDAWKDKIADWVKDGAKTGAELLVFPEYGAIEQAHALGPEVYDQYVRVGADPWIYGPDVTFSAWTYAKQLSAEMCG